MDDDLALLTGSEAGELLRVAVATAGGQLLTWSPAQVDHRPGTSTTVSYRARVSWTDGERDELLGASTGLPTSDAERPGVLVLSDGQRTVAVWMFPLDPALPALATAYDAGAVSDLVTSFGVPPGPVRLRLRAYRPRRRAVVQARVGDATVFLKVVRPHTVADLHTRHRLLHEAGVPVPRSLGWSDDGLLVLEALPGRSLRRALRGDGSDVPSGDALLALLDRLPSAVTSLPRRSSWSEGAAHYAGVLGAALPEVAGEAAEVCSTVLDAVARTAPAAPEPTHGDLYESQLLLSGNRITGVLDVDTAGPGCRADDLACLLGHLSVLALMRPDRAPLLRATGVRWLAAAEHRCAPEQLRPRIAGVVLSLATGPHRVQEHDWQQSTRDRLALARAWAGAHESTLTPFSSSAHVADAQ